MMITLLTTSLVAPFTNAQARENSLSGAISLEQGHQSNVFQTETDHVSEWKTTVKPELKLTSTGSDNTVIVNMKPAQTYNHRRDEIGAVHTLSLDADKKMSSQWQLFLSDNYSYSDNPVHEVNATISLTQQFLRTDAASQEEIVRLLFPELMPWMPEADMPLVKSTFQQEYDAATATVQNQVIALLQPAGTDSARKRFWTNNVAVRSEYEFAKDSIFTAGYSYTALDNTTGSQSDSGIHKPNLALTYRFNPEWLAELGLGYTKRDFDTAEDNSTDHANLGFTFKPDQDNIYSAAYTYDDTDFDNDSSDQTDHSLQMKLQRAIDSKTSFNATFDTSYLRRDTSRDERDVNLGLNLSRNYELSTVSLSGSANLAEDDAAGSWNRARRSWQLRGNMTYQIMENLSAEGYAACEKRFAWTNSTKNTYDDLTAGVSISRTFMKFFIFSLRYDYHLYDSDNAGIDDYVDHRLAFTISAAKELWRW